MKTLNFSILLLVSLLVVVQMTFWWPHLPAVMPSHFDDLGNVNGQMEKSNFYLLFGLIQLSMLPGFLCLGSLLSRLPNSLINLPNKDFWLAPERRQETMEVSKNVVMVFGWLTALFMMAIFHLTAMVGCNARDSISPDFTWLMIAYLASMFGVCAWLLLRFRKPQTIGDLVR